MSEFFKKPIVKTLMLKGQEGQSIKGIKKTSTNGFVDTYTITLTDGTTSTFTVTNGREISDISKTGTSGFVDTYTITFNDGATSTFTVTNGKEISGVSKTETSGLVDTYTITFNDGTKSTFTVTNGKEISSIKKTGTKGLVDTYTITFNDGTTSTFTVTNGDSAYKPAVDALGKRIDNLILSSGNESSAEVNDARTGYDGKAYPTLGTAIRTQVNDIVNTVKQYTEEVGTVIDSSIFKFGIIDNAGNITEDTDTVLKNIFSELLSIKGTVITPIKNDTIFKVVYYTEDGTFISSTNWMGLSSYTIVKNYTIDGDYCRICIANSNQSVGTTTVKQHLDKYWFDGNLKAFIKGEKVLFHNNEIEESVLLPFNGFRIEPKLFKQNGKYYSKINPRDNYIKKTNGVVVYMSPNGTDDADGLTVITPVKTLTKALTVENVNTIICLEGTYVSGTHYSSGQIVTKEVNIIGIGNAVFDNLTNPCIRFYRSVYCENIHFKGGDTTVACELSTTDRAATFYKCIFSESTANNGLSIFGGNAYVIECIAYGNAFDGFNYHAKESVVNHSIEINCKSYGNGTKRLNESDGQSSNATTSHDGSYIVRVNGDYQCCHGGVVADKECFSANYGCSSGVSTVTDASYPDRMSNYWSSNANMYLYDCISYGSKYDTAKINGGKIISNIEYTSNYLS